MVIGMTMALPDGTLARSGGRVVKNVAGYDLARLMTGSHGSLAAIVTVTVKLVPVPPVSRTIAATLRHPDDVSRVIAQLRERQCEPEAIDVAVSRAGSSAPDALSLLIRYASIQRAVDNAVATTLACMDQVGATAVVTEGSNEAQIWREHAAAPWANAATVARVSWRPAEFGQAWQALRDLTRDTPLQWTGRGAVGSGLLGLGGDPASHVRIIDTLRASPLFAHVTIGKATAALRAVVDVWQIPPAQQALWDALKRACDPTNTLNAGRGPL